MNIALEKTEEYVNGQKRRTYGDAFVRGNNGTNASPFPCPAPQGNIPYLSPRYRAC